MQPSEYNHLVKQFLAEHGINIVTFADLRDIDSQIRFGLNYGICFAIPLDVFPETECASEEYYTEYRRINAKLKEISLLVEKRITEIGFSALSLTRNKQNEDYRTILPFKTLATKSGLGWIGKSSLLITQEYGSAIRLNGVITNMPLETTDPIYKSLCGNCRACVDACPAGAIKGVLWEIEKDRDELIDPVKCKRKVIERGKQMGVTVGSCGICISVCPWTKKYIGRK